MTELVPASVSDPAHKTIEEIYDAHFHMVYRLSFSYLKNPADAEDAAAEVFAKLMGKNIIFDNVEHEKAWLIRATVNLCKDMLSHWWRRRADIDAHQNLPNQAGFHLDETLQAVLELPPRYKDAIYLYYYEGYTTQEIAGILHKPHSTIRGHLREARKLLGGILENEK